MPLGPSLPIVVQMIHSLLCFGIENQEVELHCLWDSRSLHIVCSINSSLILITSSVLVASNCNIESFYQLKFKHNIRGRGYNMMDKCEKPSNKEV